MQTNPSGFTSMTSLKVNIQLPDDVQ
jgi:hypothetical protein